ncbi:tyrosine-type recombinase/integrase [Promicromonospora sp. NPDC057138]|uniref:tyrosine-type recombinase/integrase n=1 Tax=Promicromonospora sp. NPDC057138 TaxID=3346031 RepID=UPI00363160D5
MARQRIPIGTFGDIYTAKLQSGNYRARTKFRDVDGHLRLVEASAETAKAAETKLKVKLAQRGRVSSRVGDLGPGSKFGELVDVWLEDLDLDGELAPNTRALYERNMSKLVLPAFEGYTLREVTVARVDRFLRSLAKTRSHSMAKQAKTVLSLALGLAVRYEAIERNPVAGVKRLKRSHAEARALTHAELEVVRAAVRGWRRQEGLSGPKPDGQLEAIIEVMIGSSARIGEVLALRKCDVDVTSMPATIRISGTIVSLKGKPTYRQPHPKSRASVRRLAVPSYTAEALRRRLVEVADARPDGLIFQTRNGTPLTTNNVRRRLREILKDTGLGWVTPHSFRRTVATTIERSAGADLAAELLGHTSSDITKLHYIEKDENVSGRTAEILESLAPKAT